MSRLQSGLGQNHKSVLSSRAAIPESKMAAVTQISDLKSSCDFKQHGLCWMMPHCFFSLSLLICLLGQDMSGTSKDWIYEDFNAVYCVCADGSGNVC